MRTRDTSDVLMGVLALVCDACAAFGGLMLATRLRFDSGWFAVPRGRPPNLYELYAYGAAFGTLLILLAIRAHGLYLRPQTGRFENKIPTMIRASGFGFLLCVVTAYAVQNEAEFSRMVLGIGFLTVTAFLLVERYILYRIEWNLARHSRAVDRVLIVGTDAVAARLQRAMKREPMLRARVIGFLRVRESEAADSELAGDAVIGTADALETIAAAQDVDRIILADSRLPHERIVEIIVFCERSLIGFNMVPDMFRILTSSMDVQPLDGVPVLGLRRWPLDYFWNRVLKRTEDIVGAALGLLVSAPVILAAAWAVKRSSPGPVFYRQERCGENGRPFHLCKLRTMRVDAEKETGPVFAVRNDPRTTRVGALLRRYNLDELPQLWNVLKGEMSLVGPRPERPHFVEQFKEDIHQYMRRHVSKPGMTGWAQVNGLRGGDTSIRERIKLDLYYLENWSLAFDLKILIRTVFARENAY